VGEESCEQVTTEISEFPAPAALSIAEMHFSVNILKEPLRPVWRKHENHHTIFFDYGATVLSELKSWPSP
jgi:hypothetical protein